MARPVVLDNTVLVNFSASGRPSLAARPWSGEVCTTPAVQDEYQQGVAQGAVPDTTWEEVSLVELSEEEKEFAGELSAKLGAGERTCLAVAFHREGLFASDDADARAVARDRDIPVTGTLGILARAVEGGMISLGEGNRLLTRMIDAGYHAPVRRLDDIL